MPLLLAKSSSGDYYEVHFDVIEGRMSVNCGCVAGALGQACKHLHAFLAGDCSMLFRPDQEAELLAILGDVNAAGLVAAFRDLQSNLQRLDAELATVKKRIEKERKGRKAAFMRNLSAGYPPP
jgi:hypothetical protein